MNAMPMQDQVGGGDDNVRTLHARLMAHASGLPNDDTLACMLATWADGGGSLPAFLGLEPAQYYTLLERHFPGVSLSEPTVPDMDPDRMEEQDELRALLLGHRAGNDPSEEWIADIVMGACMAGNHLWQDLGLWSRRDLSDLMIRNFPALAAKNDRDMKWKKFLYKQLCIQEGIYTCRSPSCEVCVDYQACFGPEE